MAKRHTKDRAEPRHRYRANTIRAARLYRPVTNSSFASDELRRILGRNGSSAAIIPQMELEICKEGHVTRKYDEIGEVSLQEKARRVLAAAGNSSFVFKMECVEPAEINTYANAPTKHAVMAVPTQETVESLQVDIQAIKDGFGFQHDGFFGGLAIAACFSRDHAIELSHTLNGRLTDLQRIGLMLGPMASRAPLHLEH